MRIDKWLWAARFFKTRSLAQEEIDKNRVKVNGQPVKPARELRIGDRVSLRQGLTPKTVDVLALSQQRGPAPVAQALYAETDESVAERAKLAEQRQFQAEPANTIEQGRPTKRDRRALDKATQKAPDWGDRWSAKLP